MSRDVNSSKKIFVVTRILVFDFELFIGDRCQNQRTDNCLKLSVLCIQDLVADTHPGQGPVPFEMFDDIMMIS